jgi:isoamylase
MRVWPGDSYPLGATFDGIGTNFSVFSEVAEAVELCVFDPDGSETRVELPEQFGGCWHGYLPDAGPGTCYGFRVHGPWDPGQGHRCNSNKLLLDPYAKAVNGDFRWNEALFGSPWGSPDARNDADSAPFMPKAVVHNPFFDWENDQVLRNDWSKTVIYEAHVKGATQLHPAVEPDLRGSYAGIAHPAFVEHLTTLGITALELLPIHQFAHDMRLVEHGLRNYWGYNSIGFFAPHNEYSHRYAAGAGQGEQVQDFKQMVKALHQAGIEVILDVVFNHTAEGNHLGPVLSFKGLDNQAYYRLVDDDPRFYMDYTGTGNTLNMRHPHSLQLLMDSLRYWVLDMHVDGFRFDLASTLARGLHEVDRLSAFFDTVQQDPVISQVKLIAEPWDVGEGGYQVGNFPPLWAEWNGKYRDCGRDFWRGQETGLGEFGYRLTGSSDLYEDDGRRPHASINFVTAHDGFTLADLVSYNDKHNEANGENNNDGANDNRSWNCGVEGPTGDPGILELRHRQQRNFWATLLLSQGIPMVLGGDELGRTQFGNNNAYCQDNEISWLHWDNLDTGLLAWATRLITFRRDHPAFRRRGYFQGKAIHGSDATDIAWFNPAGEEMTEDDWEAGFAKTLGMFLNGDALEVGRRGEVVVDDSFLVLINAYWEPVPFTIPEGPWGEAWDVVLDSHDPTVGDPTVALATPRPPVKAGDNVTLGDRSIQVLRRDKNLAGH